MTVGEIKTLFLTLINDTGQRTWTDTKFETLLYPAVTTLQNQIELVDSSYFSKTTSVSVAVNTVNIDLQTVIPDYRKLLLVERINSEGFPTGRINFIRLTDKEQYIPSIVPLIQELPNAYLIKDTLVFESKISTQFTAQFTYSYGFKTVLSFTSSYTAGVQLDIIPHAFHELVAYSLAQTALFSEGADPQRVERAISRKLNDLKDDFDLFLRERQQQQPKYGNYQCPQ